MAAKYFVCGFRFCDDIEGAVRRLTKSVKEKNDIAARYERLKLLYEVFSRIHSTLEPKQALNLIVESAVSLMNASSGSMVLVNPTSGFLEIEASYGLPAGGENLRLRVGEGITGWVAKFGKSARVSDVTKDSRYVTIWKNVRSEMAVPIFVNESVRGVLNVDSERLNGFSEEDQQMLESLANEAARVIQNTWLYEQLRQKVNLFQSLASAIRVINSTLNIDEVLPLITQQARQLMRARMSSLLLLDETGEWLQLQSCDGASKHYLNKPQLNVDESLLGVVVKRRKPIQVENVQQSSLYQAVEIARREGLVSLLSVPLLFQQEAIGVLNVYTGEPYKFSNEEVQIMNTLAELSAIAIQKSRLYKQMVDLEEQIRRSERLSLLGLISAEVAHEIRNPLTVMKLLFHSLDFKFPENDPRSKDVQIIAQKMEDMNKIVERILDFARKDELNFSELNINKVIEELAILVRQRLQSQNITLACELSRDLPVIQVDRVQIEQAFLNLILNSAEAMPQGGKLLISTGVIRQNDKQNFVFIQFKDTGKGMPQEVVKRAFDSLFSASKPKGTGLGLAIVKRIVDLHKGKIEVQSKTKKGTTIRIFLPLN
ncbi:MAG: GAF domain-containing protein [Verrucomicrobiia bacterium]